MTVAQADIGVKDGKIKGIGKAGNPDVMAGVHPDLIVGSATEVIAGEKLIVTAGAVDAHCHYICPQQVTEALASGTTTMIGGGTGPSAGTNATTCTPSPFYMQQMLAAIGETFDPALTTSNEEKTLITGVIVSSRPQFYRVSIWTRLAPQYTSTSEDQALKERIEAIGKTFKMGVLGYSEGQKLAGALATEVEFASHKDSEKKGRAKKLYA